MALLDQIASCIPISSMTYPLQLADIAFGGSFDEAACAFYKMTIDYESMTADSPQISKHRRWSPAVPFIASFERLVDLTSLCVEASVGDAVPADEFGCITAFTEGISLVLKLVIALSGATSSPGPLTVAWDAESWLDNTLRPLGSRVEFMMYKHTTLLTYKL